MASGTTTRTQMLDPDRIAAFITRRQGGAVYDLGLDVQPLRGGLQAATVARVRARFLDERTRPQTTVFVVKRLEGDTRREAAVYESLLGAPGAPAPRLLGVDGVESGDCYLYLERINPCRSWPWREVSFAGSVLEQLAGLHHALAVAPLPEALTRWNYEAELLASAQSTATMLEATAARRDLDVEMQHLRRGRLALRRLADALPAIRRHLLAAGPLGVTVIHGDAHPGNAMVRAQGGGRQAVLLDWGRARLGSPLEDVSSWLQSLGCWEPEARRRHDTLLRRYLRARRVPEALTRDLRDAYWLAGACNALAGALRYHLARLDGWGSPTPRERAGALRAARDCLRVIRRADACWHG